MLSQPYTLADLGVSDFLELTQGSSSAFISHGEGLIGFGVALRLEAQGPNRIAELNRAWQQSVNSATVEDQVNISGSGLIAFGSIAFAEQSNAKSVLVIPKTVIGLSGTTLWVTTINSNIEDVLDGLKNTTEPKPLRFESGQISPEQFQSNINLALTKIENSEIEKVVLARDLVSQVPIDFDYSYAIQKLATKFESCFTYNVYGLFGASPELLVKVSHSQVSARVLAGTAGRGTDPGVDTAIGNALISSHKNLEEHRFAVESLVTSLEALAENIDADETPFSLALPNLWHLASDVHAVLKSNSTSLQVVEVLHPSAAVAGTPRDKALAVIAEIEQIDRGRYAGPIGWLGADGDGVWAIALRGAQFDKEQHTVTAFAGCGIVSESEPEAELAETNLKFKPILDALS